MYCFTGVRETQIEGRGAIVAVSADEKGGRGTQIRRQ
jgi:hypothetical protein